MNKQKLAALVIQYAEVISIHALNSKLNVCISATLENFARDIIEIEKENKKKEEGNEL